MSIYDKSSVKSSLYYSSVLLEKKTANDIITAQNKPTYWSWKFGDGSISTIQKPVHKYTKKELIQ
jgi:hypothetical protein